ncbi:hypothetical protein BCR32DRAFT_212511, partial [Anaeromyces robustus]
LIIACQNGNVKMAKFLIKHGADINKVWKGLLPLNVACLNGNEKLIKYLI